MKTTEKSIKDFLLINGIKQCWLAKQMLMSESMLSLLLNNKRAWRAKHIVGLSSILEMLGAFRGEKCRECGRLVTKK